MQINSITLPTNTFDNAAYRWTPPATLAYAGDGEPIQADGATLELFYPRMHPDDWEFWTQTVLGGNSYAEFTTAQLHDDDGTLTTFTHCIVYRPVRGKWEMGYHADTTVLITDIY